MHPILEWGVSLVLALQNMGTWLVGPMKAFTFLGNEEFFLLIAPILVWCLDSAIGVRMGLLLMLSGCLNTLIKISLLQPRPYWVDPRVIAYTTEISFGLPSGHAQHAMAVWGSLAAWLRKPWAWIVAGLLIFFIGLSRLYLGVHFPTDVLFGWILGALLLWAFLRLEPPVLAWLKLLQPYQQTLLALAGSLILLALAALLRLSRIGWEMPTAWLSTIAVTAPGAELPVPLSLTGLVSNAGAFFGLAAGAIGLQARGGFQPRGTTAQLALRYVIGLVGVLLLWRGLGLLLPGDESLSGYFFRYLRYILIGLWVTGLAPFLFIRLRLAQPLKNTVGITPNAHS